MQRLRLVTVVFLLAVLLDGRLAAAQADNPPRAANGFEQVSIRPSDSGIVGFQFLPDRFLARTVTLRELIEQAYDLAPWHVAGGPEWVGTERFTVRATTADPVDRQRMRGMLQGLLADHFGLVLVHDTQPGVFYRLQARGDHRLTVSRSTGRASIDVQRREAPGYLSYVYVARNATLDEFAQALSRRLRAPVVNQTKLAGAFNFRVNFTEEEDVLANQEPASGVPRLPEALERQLRLRLIADSGPIPVYFIESARRPVAEHVPAATRP